MTPTPWEALDSHVSQRQKLLFSPASTIPFATITFTTNVLGKGVSQKDIEAITKFIVKACNCHNALLEALKGLLDVCYCTNDCAPDDMSCASNLARAAISKAE